MKKQSNNKKQCNEVEKFKAVIHDHVNASRKAFDIACRELEAITGYLQFIENPGIKKIAYPVKTEKAVKKPAPKQATPVKKAKTAKITKTEADKAKPNVVRQERPVKKAAKPVAKKEQVAEQVDPAPVVHHRTPDSVRLTPHEITLNIGGFNVKELAERDAKEFLSHPNVFWYRSTVFPDPRRYGVQPSCESARAVKRTDPKFGSEPWTVSVTIHIEGDDKKCDSWGVGVYNRNKAAQE